MRGFPWFVVGLVIATFIGGAVRTVLTSDRVHKRIVAELRGRFPQQEFQIGHTEVLLSRGLWPSVGLRVKNLNFRQEVCGKLSFIIDVPEAVLPVDLWALVKGMMRLGHVELTGGNIHLNYIPCPIQAAAPVVEVTKPKKPMISAPSLDWNKVSAHLNAIELENFTLTYERNVTWKILVPSMRFDFAGDLSAHGQLEIQKSLPFGVLSHMVELDAKGDDRVMNWRLQSEFKEGRVQLKGSLDLNTQGAELTAFAHQLPVKDVVAELYQMGFLKRDLRLKANWLSCGLRWEGAIEKPGLTPVLAQDCKLEGGYGRLDIEGLEFWIAHPLELKKPAVIRVSKLQMQPLLEALDREVLPKVLARPGVWSGELTYLNPGSWNLDGSLDSVEVIFSNRSVRGKQGLEKLRTKVQHSQSRIQGSIDALEIRDGEFAGHVKFNLAEDWRNGEFNADIEKLRFSSSIQNLLVGGALGNLKFTGKGTLIEGELGRWDGDFVLDSVAAAGWTTEEIKVQSRYSRGVFHLAGQAKSGSLRPEWALHPQLLIARPEALDKPVFWRDLQANVDIQANGGRIEQVSGLEAESKQPWRLSGNWIRDGEFNALLVVGKAKSKTFTLSGEKGLLNVEERLR
jgi:hypothetical protein